MPRILLSVLWIALTLPAAHQAFAQESPASPPPNSQSSNQPQVKVNMLNVCTPSAEEQKEIASALARVPKEPLFGGDFEVSRGRSTLSDMPNFLQPGQSTHVAGEPSVASYVRIRREFSVQALFSSVQYSFSNDGQNMVETLVLHVRDPKDLMEVSLEDSATAVVSSDAMLGSNSPASRIRLERFGKASVALARCMGNEGGPVPDQSAYEPLFRNASAVLSNYRALLSVKKVVPEELASISSEFKQKTPSSAKANKPAQDKKAQEKKAPDKK